MADKTQEKVQHVLEDYYTERNSVINSSMSRNESGSEFYELVKIEKEILQILESPGNVKLKIMYVLHEKLQSINKVKNNIAEERSKGDQLGGYIVSNYESRLELLRSEVSILQNASK